MIKIAHLNHTNTDSLCPVHNFGRDIAEKAITFHRSFPEYAVTPLISLKNLAAFLGVKSIHVKDESYRFNLNAFKVLGGSYAIGSYFADKLNMDIRDLPYERLISDEIRSKMGEITFVTATDGNHGRGIAWTGNRLKQKSVVYMPKGSAYERLNNIQLLGADASILNMNYDEAVRYANQNAKKFGWIMVQDTAWDGYESIPTWIMQGYTTMAFEAVEQLGNEKPTHIFLQAGVGAMSGGLTGFFTDLYGDEERPIITIVEPDKADCIFRTAVANDGKLHNVKGDMTSIMAGLCCGEPCTIGWNVLRDHADNFISMDDTIAALGMRILGNPIKDDPRVISGESGAATLGLVAEVLRNPQYEYIKQKLQIDENSRILCFSTEGATDIANYRKIVWNGVFTNED